MTTEKIEALWLEDNDIVLINGATYEVEAVEGFDMVDIHMVDEEGFRKVLTVPADTKLTVIMSDTNHNEYA
jgi:hypothetical protein